MKPLSCPLKLRFDPQQFPELHKEDLRTGLSGVARQGPHLWSIADEAAAIERLREVKPGEYAEHRSFPLSDLIDFPDPDDSDFDLEGIDCDGKYVWICGSHSLSRKKPDPPEHDGRLALKQLRDIRCQRNHYLLARIPLTETGELRRKDGDRRAGVLRGGDHKNELAKALCKDPVLSTFVALPDKDNGPNIEGIAVHGKKVFLGLRSPVINGWAVVLCIEVEEDGPGLLRLKKRGPEGRLFTKHFFPCEGLGFRDLKFDGEDLLLIAGPALIAKSPFVLYRWTGAARARNDSFIHEKNLLRLGELPTRDSRNEMRDRAEGLALLNGEAARYLVVHDKPAPWRIRRSSLYIADVYQAPKLSLRRSS